MTDSDTSRRTRVAWLFASAASLALAGCFDGGSSTPTPPPPPPTAADQVPAAVFASVMSLDDWALDQTTPPNTLETTEALKLDLVGDAPTTETDEPITLP